MNVCRGGSAWARSVVHASYDLFTAVCLCKELGARSSEGPLLPEQCNLLRNARVCGLHRLSLTGPSTHVFVMPVLWLVPALRRYPVAVPLAAIH